MKRLCFVIPNLEVTQLVVKEVEHLGVLDSKIHVLGKYSDEVTQAHLHNATVLQTTDLIPALKRGALLGIFLIFAIYLIFYLTLPSNVSMSGMAMIAIVLFGIFFGLWASAMIGIGVPNKMVEGSSSEIAAGHYLLMLDIPAEREKDLTFQVLKDFPEVHLAKQISSTPTEKHTA